MGWSTAHAAIEDKFDGWTATTIKWPNKPFQEPNGPYIAVNILDGEASYATMAAPEQRRHVGVVSVQVFVKENSGEETLRSIADQIEVLFIHSGSQTIVTASEHILFDQPALTPAQTINGWRQRNVNVPFYRDDFK